MEHKRTLTGSLRRNGTALLLTGLLFWLVYTVVFKFRLDMEASDFSSHMAWAIAMDKSAILSSFVNGGERLWHICVNLLFFHVVHNTWKAAAIVTAAADAIAYFLVFKTWDRALPEKCPRWLFAILTACVFLVGSLTLPGHTFYLGRGAVNTWHNPTNIMVRPFAAAVFFMTVNIYNRRRYGRHSLVIPPEDEAAHFSFSGGFWHGFRDRVYTRSELVLYPVCILFSTYAKPSFLQFFAPAILIFCLIDVFRTRGRLLPFCLKLAAAYIPAALILSLQLTTFFGVSPIDMIQAIFTSGSAADTVSASASSAGDGAGLAIYFIRSSFSGPVEVIQVAAKNIFALVYPCAFPLFILLAAPRRGWRSAALRLSWLGVIVALLESFFIHEVGYRASHGNFLWGYYLSIWLLWTASIGQYAVLLQEKNLSGRLVRWGGSALLAWHLICGALYLVHILQTGLYMC